MDSTGDGCTAASRTFFCISFCAECLEGKTATKPSLSAASSAAVLCSCAFPHSACPGPSNWKVSVQELCKCHCNLRISPKARLLLAWGKGCSSLEMPFHPWEVSAFLIQLFPGPHGSWTNRCQIICFYFREHESGWISEKHWSCAHLFLPSLGVIWIRFEPLSVFQKAAKLHLNVPPFLSQLLWDHPLWTPSSPLWQSSLISLSRWHEEQLNDCFGKTSFCGLTSFWHPVSCCEYRVLFSVWVVLIAGLPSLDLAVGETPAQVSIRKGFWS